MPITRRERPQCRKVIVRMGIRPLLDKDGLWDKAWVVHPDGTEAFVSSGMRSQVWKMIDEGCFPEVKGIVKPERQERGWTLW